MQQQFPYILFRGDDHRHLYGRDDHGDQKTRDDGDQVLRPRPGQAWYEVDGVGLPKMRMVGDRVLKGRPEKTFGQHWLAECMEIRPLKLQPDGKQPPVDARQRLSLIPTYPGRGIARGTEVNGIEGAAVLEQPEVERTMRKGNL